jgi:hypothetical protein
MDFEKLLKFASSSLSQYIRDFIYTLTRAWSVARPAQGKILSADGLAIGGSVEQDPMNVLNADLWVFVFVSIFLGSTLTGMVADQKSVELQKIAVYVAVSWMAFALYSFLLAKYLLRGTADFLSTARATLYCLGTTFVIASFASLLGSFAPPEVNEGHVYTWVPQVIYLASQGVLLAVLLGRNFRALNGFRGRKLWVFIFLAPVPILLINLLVSMGFWAATIEFHK